MKFCSLMSSSAGNAFYLESGQTRLMIDAGQSGRALTEALEVGSGCQPQELAALFLSHGHRDHVQGAGVMARRYKQLSVYATEGTWGEMEQIVGPICPTQKKTFSVGKIIELGDLKIKPFRVAHDACDPVGFLFSNGEKRLGMVTDSGIFTSEMVKTLYNADCLVLEANHDPDLLWNGSYPWPLKKRVAGTKGHLSNQAAGEALAQIIGPRTRQIVLIHLSRENNQPELALETVKGILKENKACLRKLKIEVAPHDQPGNYITI